ncbi:sugar isomerase [Trichophyton equinum CBS 127.97]|uniref:Sugar isomerase n=1 Tax=Trichophyton equinum (strain ATCC MYA-4606 / CBS 127.97) TaxID=559882 RepID=F2Q104_TRIEC|nr:sugar isomerase [Trichophyton equinum CBS 127.97]
MVSTFYARKRTRQLSPMSPPIVASNPQTIKSSLIPPLPMTPPDPDVDSASSSSPHPSSVDTAIHVIATERAALENLERVYSTNELARNNMDELWNRLPTLSMRIQADWIYCSFLHPTEALHGDLGMVRPTDTVLFITYSGKTSELLLVLPHLPPTTSVIVITAYKQPSSCPLLAGSSNANTILLPSPIHEPEEVSFGVCAPTSSTTVALAVGDALALAVARRLHTTPGRGPAEVFKGYHPGGAIGAAAAAAASTSISGSSTPLTSTSTTPSQSMSVNGIQDESEPSLPPAETTLCRSITDIMIPAELIPTASPRNGYPLRVVDVMRASLQGSTSKPWAFIRPGYIVSPRRLRSMVACNDPEDSIENVDRDMSIGQQIEEWIRVPSTSTVDNVRQTLGRQKQNNIASPLNAAMKRDSEGNTVHRKRRVISVINEMTNTVVGFAEEEDLEHSEDMFK